MKKFISGLLIGLIISAGTATSFAAIELKTLNYKERAIEQMESAFRTKRPTSIALRNLSSITFGVIGILEEMEEQNDKLDQMIKLLEEK